MHKRSVVVTIIIRNSYFLVKWELLSKVVKITSLPFHQASKVAFAF